MDVSLDKNESMDKFISEVKINMDQMKQFCGGLTNDTLAAIEDMRHEVLTASDKSMLVK